MTNDPEPVGWSVYVRSLQVGSEEVGEAVDGLVDVAGLVVHLVVASPLDDQDVLGGGREAGEALAVGATTTAGNSGEGWSSSTSSGTFRAPRSGVAPGRRAGARNWRTPR